MKLFYIGVLFKDVSKTTEIVSEKDLSLFSFFEKSSVSQFMTFFSETISHRTKEGERQSVGEGTYVGHTYVGPQGIACVIISDLEYPARPAYTLINNVLDEFFLLYKENDWKMSVTDKLKSLQFENLKNYLKTYQNPVQADSIMKVQHELDETKFVLYKTIESVLQRGEKLDNLIDKSEALTASSKMFYKQAKKTNSCCSIV